MIEKKKRKRKKKHLGRVDARYLKAYGIGSKLIKKILGMPQRSEFIRCAGKNNKVVKELESNGDFSHSAKSHICEKCQCHRYAGAMTKGDFYGIGFPELGHLGVGYCKYHEMGRWKLHANKFANKQVELMRTYDMKKVVDYKTLAEIESAEAKYSMDIRNGMVELNEYISGFIAKLKDMDTNLLVGSYDKNGDKVPMSDKDKAYVICELMKTLSKLSIDRFHIEKVDMISIDEIKIRIPRLINLGKSMIEKTREKVIKQDVDMEGLKAEYIDGLRNIFSSLK